MVEKAREDISHYFKHSGTGKSPEKHTLTVSDSAKKRIKY